jgi:hypothetical protein
MPRPGPIEPRSWHSVNYYAEFKLSDDHIEGFPDILIRGKNKTFARRGAS